MRVQHWTGSSSSERGTSATEYALLIAGIAVVLVGLVALFGQSLVAHWQGFAEML